MMTSDEARHAELTAGFERRYARAPEIFVRAPGRVDAMGSHTDYNEGFVLTLPIDRDTWIAAAPRGDGQVRVESLNVEGRGVFDVRDGLARRCEGWPIYVQAVVHVLAAEGFEVGGFDALVHGTLPIASGLSSSASLEAATAVLLGEFGGFELAGVRMARLCQRAENEVVGVNCGVLDQYSSILGEAGSALLLDCRRLTHVYVPMPAGLGPVVCHTQARRELTGSDYGARRSSCEAGARMLAAHVPGTTALRDVDRQRFAALEGELDPVVARRCRFVIEENERVHELARAFRAGDRAAIGRTCERSFAGARDLFEITIPEMEAMYTAMTRAPGCVGARQAGAGFGGCMIAWVDVDAIEAFAASVLDAYASATGMRPEVLPVAPAPGAGRLAGGSG